MAGRYLQTYLTPGALAAQARYYGRARPVPSQPDRDPLTDEEIEFIGRRDSFYLATVTPDGWPYLQHRGGRPGFLRVTDPHTLAFADYRGNRQLLSTGNLDHNTRVALFLMDYPRRERLKILGQARVLDAREHPEAVSRTAEPPDRPLVERLFVIDVLSFDWNCPQFITPRYTEEEIQHVVGPLKQRITDLEAQIPRTGRKPDTAGR